MTFLPALSQQLSSGSAPGQPPIIIYNNDVGGDYDGAFATAIIAAAHAQGRCTIAAVLCEDSTPISAAFAFQVLQSAGVAAANIPIGYYQGAYGVPGDNPQAAQIGGISWGVNVSPTPTTFSSNLVVARTALQALVAAGQRCIFLTAGENCTLADLLASPADGISPLTGAQLFSAAVRKIVTMGGNDHNNNSAAAEYNIAASGSNASGAVAAQNALHALVPQIERVWISFQTGGLVQVAPPINVVDPVSNVFVNALVAGGLETAWDGIATLAALMDGGGEFLLPAIKRGTCTVNPYGTTTWSLTPGPDTSLGLNPNVTTATLTAMLQALYAPSIPVPTAPSAPTVAVDLGSSSPTTLSVSGVRGAAGGVPTGYTFQLLSAAGTVLQTSPAQAMVVAQGVFTLPHYTFTGLTAGTTYKVQALATNPTGSSAYGAPTTVVTSSTVAGSGSIAGLIQTTGYGAFTVPDAANFNHATGNLIDVQVLITAPSSWTQVSGQDNSGIISKQDSGGYSQGWRLNINSNGTPEVLINGSFYTLSGSAAISPGATTWVRWVVNYGAANIVGRLPLSIASYTSTDGVTWANAASAGIFTSVAYNSSAPLMIGNENGGPAGLTIRRVKIFNNGTLALDADLTSGTAGAGTFVAATGQTLTGVSGTTLSAAVAETATITAPSAGTAGVAQAISGTVTSGGTIYAGLYVGGVLQGALVAATVTGTAWTVNLTPAAAGTYAVEVFQSSSGGTALATSNAFTVAAAAPSATTISSATINAAGTQITLQLSQAATLATVGSFGLIVGGTSNAITWTAPGTAATSFTGTLAGTVTTGQTCIYTTTSTNFTSPALAAIASGVAVTNNSTVSGGGYGALTMSSPVYVAGQTGFGQALSGGTGTGPVSGMTSSSNFTIEMNVLMASSLSNINILNLSGTGQAISAYVDGSGHPNFYFVALNHVAGGTAPVGSWFHLCCVFTTTDGGTTWAALVYINGYKVGGGADAPPFTSPVLTLNPGTGVTVDEVRLSNVARYTGNFTPPTAPFTHDANTLLLAHLDGNGNLS